MSLSYEEIIRKSQKSMDEANRMVDISNKAIQGYDSDSGSVRSVYSAGGKYAQASSRSHRADKTEELTTQIKQQAATIEELREMVRSLNTTIELLNGKIQKLWKAREEDK